MKEQIEKLNKKQLFGLRSYRRATLCTLSLISLIVLWFKVGLFSSWHLNDVIVEVVTIFILVFMGILANVKNNFPIFQFRKFKFNKEFTYSIISAFSLLFIFVIYKNIVDPDFISYIAELSFHDLCSIVVFLMPIFLFIIYLIYLSFKLFNVGKKSKKNKFEIYEDIIEDNLNHYKSTTIKVIFVIMIVSLWVKVGFNSSFTFYQISTEVFSLITIITFWLIGNYTNKLSLLYNCHIKLDKYLFYSILLPYLLVFIYTILSSDFRFLILNLGFKGILSLIVYTAPLNIMASIIFYIGCRYPNKFKLLSTKLSLKKNRVRVNTIVSLLITFVIIIGVFLYWFMNIITKHTLENILQVIIILIPLFVIIYLILYSGIKEINK